MRIHRSTATPRGLAALLAGGLLLAGCGGQEPEPPPADDGAQDAADEAGAGESPDDADEADQGSEGGSTDGGGSDEGADASPGDADGADGASAAGEPAMTECAAERFTVPYPADWQVNDGERLGDCRIFHPGEITVSDQPQDRDLHWAASLYLDSAAWADVQPDGEEGEVLSQEELTLDGHRAIAYEYESNGQALVPEGERGYVYLVDLEDRVLVATTSSVGETDYERDKAVLDEMLGGLTTPAAGQGDEA